MKYGTDFSLRRIAEEEAQALPPNSIIQTITKTIASLFPLPLAPSCCTAACALCKLQSGPQLQLQVSKFLTLSFLSPEFSEPQVASSQHVSDHGSWQGGAKEPLSAHGLRRREDELRSKKGGRTISRRLGCSARQARMYVIKRDGRKEAVHFDKITARIRKLSYGLNPEHCEPVLVAQKVTTGVYTGVTTSELDELAAETAASMTAKHPDYAQVGVFPHLLHPLLSCARLRWYPNL